MKRGFTLIETVVTVGIVAAMAAVVIPQVAKQFDTADPTRIQNDLKNLQTAMETYFVNVKELPADIDDLANPITVTDDSLIGTGITITALAGSGPSLWKGPYVDMAVVANGDDDVAFPTGYGARIVEGFVCYNATNNEHGVTDSTLTTADADGPACDTAVLSTEQGFLAIQIIGLSCDVSSTSTTFMTINALFDSGETTVNAASSGRVRCTAATTAPNKQTSASVVYFLAISLT